MGSSNGSSGISKRKQITRGRKRDDLPSLGIVARRAASRFSISRQNKNVSIRLLAHGDWTICKGFVDVLAVSKYSRNVTTGKNHFSRKNYCFGRRIGINIPINKYANRRTSFFKSTRPQKATSQKAGLQCHDALWDKRERLFRTGDIVSVTDRDNSLCYFAQIRALLCDQFGERFAALTLVPTELADEAHQFDAEHFVHALSDSVMYPLEVCTFVQHTPLLPGYCHDWKPRSLLEKKLLEELEGRVRAINTLSTKLIAFDEKIPPLKSK
uniref:BAH domain-containing protein n=1 Tax=Elaeophora elaphi TaxID=1147741 RepID=A0A0R3RM11_9BILA